MSLDFTYDRRDLYPEKINAIYTVAKFRPVVTSVLVVGSVFTALLEGIGLSFILPIVEQARGAAESDPSGIMSAFIMVYDFIGIPFSLGYIVLGVSLVITLRYCASFVVIWFRVALQKQYLQYLRSRSFGGVLDAEIPYFDNRGSDDILNAIITQTEYAEDVIGRLIKLLQVGLVSLAYLSIAVYLSPLLTTLSAVIFGLSTVVTRTLFESGIDIGDRIATANENIQKTVQTGTQGIRDIKLFGMEKEVFSSFRKSMENYVNGQVSRERNSEGIDKFHRLVSAVSVFVLIYLGLEFAAMSIGNLGVFLFAMFRLSPRISTLNNTFYRIEADMPHLVRAQSFINEIESKAESTGGRRFWKKSPNSSLITSRSVTKPVNRFSKISRFPSRKAN